MNSAKTNLTSFIIMISFALQNNGTEIQLFVKLLAFTWIIGSERDHSYASLVILSLGKYICGWQNTVGTLRSKMSIKKGSNHFGLIHSPFI